jgi:signal transduction histidine kinase/ActR/RegA family two-component response regulator
VKTLSARDALIPGVRRVSDEDNPRGASGVSAEVFAVFDQSAPERFLGLVTWPDVARFPHRIFADLLPRPAPEAVRPETPLEEVYQRLVSAGLDVWPVVEADGRFVGAVSRASLLEALLRHETELLAEARHLRAVVERQNQTLAERTERLEALNRASHRLLSLLGQSRVENPLFQSALESVAEIVGARYAFLQVFDASGRVVQFLYHGMTAEQAARIGRWPERKGLLGLVLESDAALRLSDLTRHPAFTGFPPGHPEMKHLLIVPIRVREKAYGQVYLADRQDGAPFSEADEAVVRSFTASVGLLLANVQAQKEQERLQQQFFQAQKMESVGRLAAGVAHDFNNLLTVIGGFTELLLARFPAEDPAHGQLEQVLAAAQRAAGLTRQLLAFSRQQVVVPRVLEVNQVVRDLAKMLVRLLGEDVELVTRLAPGVHPICADPGQLEMVLMNLAVNARDAMPEGGRLVLESANVSLDEAYARSHPDAQPGEHVVLTVSDTGCGMSEEVKAHCFEPFFTTKERGKGTGLGLATVYGIVRQCGGHITVDSQPGQGTTFRLYFPATASSAPVLPSRAARVAPRPGGGETILVVEDEEGLRRLIGPALEGVGYRVLLAPDAATALRLVETAETPVDLLLTDVVLPRTGGWELAEQLRARRPEVKVLFMSGYSDHTTLQQKVLEPGHHFLPKPFTTSELLEKVREALDAPPAAVPPR